MSVVAKTAALLVLSNIFMTFAWYAHLKELNQKPWIVAAFASWGIALFEYLLQVPANRIGYTTLELGQLKILQAEAGIRPRRGLSPRTNYTHRACGFRTV